MIETSKWSLRVAMAAILCAATLAPLTTRAQDTAQARTIVTADTKHNELAPVVPEQSVTVSQSGKRREITDWVPLRGTHAGLQLAILLDDSARSGLALQLPDVKRFIMALPPTTQVAVGYMRNGIPNLIQPFTADHAAAARGLRIPSGAPGANASPYFSLSELVKHWPNPDPNLRREVLMITDGVDRYYGPRFDPENPYVQAAISDAQRAGVLVYSIYYRDTGDRGPFITSGGQDYLVQVGHATGGQAYYLGTGNPVSFRPFLDDLQRKLQNQYELAFAAPPNKNLQPLQVKTTQPNTKLTAPERVAVRQGAAQP